tara:strand:+ start:1720 stop:3303 length:1584 start_codon:yes stop_codon:yes gene_type:complete
MALTPSEFNKIKKNTQQTTQQKMVGKYQGTEGVDMPMGSDEYKNPDGSTRRVQIEDRPRSLFSSHHLFYLKKGDGGNYPLTEDQMKEQQELFKNVTPLNLVDNPQGALIYSPNDFLYLKDINSVPLNRLITLNKFAFPCADNIKDSEFHQEPPISTMLSFATQDYNKFSDIMKMSMGLRWVEKTSTIEEINTIGDPSGFGGGSNKKAGGVASNILSVVSPEFGSNSIRGENALAFNPYHDTNKVYGQVDSIDSTHLRERGLDFTHEFELTFKYEMRSHNGISQKAAFVDLLSNIFLMTTNDATFWGGARFYTGQRPSKMSQNMRFMQPRDYNDFISKGKDAVKGFLGSLGDIASIDGLKKIAGNIANLALGKMMDKIGRPSISYMNSLLTNDPVGNYHLLIGNPFNPILSIGNLINSGASTVTFGDELGYEDFPTEITVTFPLKHAMPRDRAAVESMFGSGSRTYWKPNDIFGSSSGISSSAQNPTSLDSFSSVSNESLAYWGNYTRDSVLRNSQEVYKYIKRQSNA